MDLGSTFRALVREIVGLPTTEGQPPRIDRLAHYRARVDACASDGSTLDVTPEDPRISPEKNVRMLVGIPSAVVTVAQGAIVWLGWDAGNPKSPHCLPYWEAGATLTKLEIGSSPDNVATKQDLKAIMDSVTGATYVNAAGVATALVISAPPFPVAYASTTVKVQR